MTFFDVYLAVLTVFCFGLLLGLLFGDTFHGKCARFGTLLLGLSLLGCLALALRVVHTVLLR